MGYEVEVKYRCADLSKLADRLRAGGAVQIAVQLIYLFAYLLL